MEQSTELRGWLGFLEDQVKLAIMAFQQDDDATFMDAISAASSAVEVLRSTLVRGK